MSLNTCNEQVVGLIKLLLEPLYKYNPFFTLYYNPLLDTPYPQVTSKPYRNYMHQVSLLLDMIPRTKIRILIGDEVGLGKTVEAIRIIKYLYLTGYAKKILVLAPKQLIKQWIYHDIRDLLYSPRRLRVVTKKSVERIAEATSRDADEPLICLAPIDLVKWSARDKHARGFFKPYYEFITGINWDLIVVDEAHQIGFASPRVSLRTSRLLPVCTRSKHLILLSATPSRGSHEDMLGRIAMLLPELSAGIKSIERNSFLRRRLYRALFDHVVYRRTKEYVNALENEPVFTKLSSLVALIKLGEKTKLYEDLGRTISLVLKSIETTASGLIKAIVLKRALSSPYAFLKTLSRVLEGRVVETGLAKTELSGELNDKLLEERVDEVVEKAISSSVWNVPSNLKQEVVRLVNEFEELYREGDPVFKALALLLYNVVQNPSGVPAELVGDYVVFSEYRDTVEYMFSKLVEFFEKRGFSRDDLGKKIIIDKTLRKYYEKKPVERIRKYSDLLDSSIEILVDVRSGCLVFLAKLSSSNQDIVHLMPELVESIHDIAKGRVLKVLLSTDIASEGLNLYQFNIVVNYDVPWSPVRREQRIGRVYRLRQSRNCTVLDIVRDIIVDYEFYTKLVLKLLNMIEQRVVSKPLEGVVELYVAKRTTSGEEYLRISESDIASALCRVYEDYYINGRSVSEVLNGIRAELAKKLQEHRDLYEDLMPKQSDIESTKSYVEELTGCKGHDHFAETVFSLYKLLIGNPPSDVSRALVDIYERTMSSGSIPLDSDTAILVNDQHLSVGYLGVVDFVIDGYVKYSTPILVLIRDDKQEVKHGVELLNWLIRGFEEGSIKLARVLRGVGRDDEELFINYIERYVNKINLLFYERIVRRVDEFKEIAKAVLNGYRRIGVKLHSPLIKVFGFESIVGYREYLSSLPEELRREMERLSIEYVKELYENRGCIVREVNIGVGKPYDLLVECVEENCVKNYMVEVKSHLKRVFTAELTPNETDVAERNPDKYIVCNVAGLENPDKSSWIVLCDLYSRLRKTLITKMKEEKVAELYFA